MADPKKASVKSKVEAVLFSVGHKITLDEISKLCRSRKEDVLLALQELQKEYDEKQSSLALVEEGDSWKFTVRDHLVSVVRKIVTETELSKSVLETLAVIAFKYPILQSDLIKIRTNKAYDHLLELEKSGYISRQKHSRTNLIKLTEKFFKYFDLTEDKLKDRFKDFGSIALAIKEKEEEVVRIKEDQRKKAEDLKKEDEKIKKEIDELDKAGEEFSIPLDKYKINAENMPESDEKKPEDKETIGDLEVVEVPEEKKKEMQKEEKQIAEETKQDLTKPTDKPQDAAKNQIEPKRQIAKKRKKGIQVTPDMEKKIDERVQKIMQGEKENVEENTFSSNKGLEESNR